MTNKQRWESILKKNSLPDDRLPVIEWSIWWTETLERWEDEGMSKGLDEQGVHRYFGLDEHRQFLVRGLAEDCPFPDTHGGARINSQAGYDALKKYLYSEQNIRQHLETALEISARNPVEKCPVSLLVEGFFWHPRELFGIENHLYAFYDFPDLMHKINQDLLEYNKHVIDIICNVLTPDIFCINEDMSYNLGPMISKEIFDKFLAPYYSKLIPYAKERGMTIFVDTDGNFEEMVPWLIAVGVEGVTPLERQAGVDVVKLLDTYPDFHAISAFDKMTMPLGEVAMRTEFERILPAMKTGRYIVSVDHQTPPGVSIENYRIYLRLLKEYCVKVVKEMKEGK